MLTQPYAITIPTHPPVRMRRRPSSAGSHPDGGPGTEDHGVDALAGEHVDAAHVRQWYVVAGHVGHAPELILGALAASYGEDPVVKPLDPLGSEGVERPVQPAYAEQVLQPLEHHA